MSPAKHGRHIGIMSPRRRRRRQGRPLGYQTFGF